MTSHSKTGLVFNIHRLSTDDGPGLRDTFFLKGCALRCEWCHNPESIEGQREVWWNNNKCIGQLECVGRCPTQALTLSSEGISIHRNLCNGCCICVDNCAAQAMEAIGETWTVEGLVAEAAKDKLFFHNSKGGVTLSGGEPLFQGPFVLEVLKRLKAEGIHTALDTCGFLLHRHLEALIPLVDLFLYDIKEINSELHQQWTGVSNVPILENLRALIYRASQQQHPPEIWIRTPLIPNRTATLTNITAIGEYLRRYSDHRITRWELCSFNNMCAQKYARLEQPWTLANEPLLNRDLGADLLAQARTSSGLEDRVFLTGLS
jgi:pyruvate formate lyase activating enzyme